MGPWGGIEEVLKPPWGHGGWFNFTVRPASFTRNYNNEDNALLSKNTLTRHYQAGIKGTHSQSLLQRAQRGVEGVELQSSC